MLSPGAMQVLEVIVARCNTSCKMFNASMHQLVLSQQFAQMEVLLLGAKRTWAVIAVQFKSSCAEPALLFDLDDPMIHASVEWSQPWTQANVGATSSMRRYSHKTLLLTRRFKHPHGLIPEYTDMVHPYRKIRCTMTYSCCSLDQMLDGASGAGATTFFSLHKSSNVRNCNLPSAEQKKMITAMTSIEQNCETHVNTDQKTSIQKQDFQMIKYTKGGLMTRDLVISPVSQFDHETNVRERYSINMYIMQMSWNKRFASQKERWECVTSWFAHDVASSILKTRVSSGKSRHTKTHAWYTSKETG